MARQRQHSSNHVEILIVEDSPTQAEQLRYLLEENGYTVRLARDGRQALEAVRQKKPTLVISDIVMPEMDGFTLCRQIKTDEALKDLPVILVTSLSSPHDIMRGLECGADNFIRKPWDEENLLDRIHYILANRILRKSENVQMGLEIDLSGQRHFITAQRQQMLGLLISTYQEAVRLNQDLERSNQSLNGLYRIAESLNQAGSEQEVCNAALNQALELPGVQAGWILLREGEAGFTVGAAAGLPPALGSQEMLEGECLCRQKLLAGEFDQVTNFRACERLQQADGDACGLRHHASFPLWVGDRILGIMNLVGPDQGLFDDEDLRILYGVGNQVGIALERARLHEHLEKMVAARTAALAAEVAERKRIEVRIQRQLRRLAALREIDRAITASLDLEEALQVLLEQTTTELDVAAAAVLLLDPQTSTLAYAAGSGFRTRHIEDTRVGLEEDLAGRAIREGRIVQANPASAADFLRWSLFEAEDFAVYFVVPLVADGKVKGVLELFHRAPFDPDKEWLDFLNTLAGQAAIAIRHADLFAETRRLLQQTQEQARRVQGIMDTVPTGVLLLQANGRILLANPVAEQNLAVLAGASAGDVLRSGSERILTHLGDRPLAEILDPASQGGWQEVEAGSRTFEVIARSMDRSMHSEDAPVRWVLVLNDVTAEREKQRYQQAQERLASVGQLAAGIAHDFNNIMGTIILYAGMLRNASDLSDRQRGQLDTVYDQAQHAASLIPQILDFSRRSVMQRAPLDLLPLVKELLKLLERTLPSNIRLDVEYDRNDYIVNGDPTRMQQVLMNLALNARDAMPSGGRLVFDLSSLSVSTHSGGTHSGADDPPLPDMEAGEWVCLAVTDTGTGIPPEVLPRIYDPFFTTKEPGKGTGLGLAQVYGIVKQHDGHIDVETQQGEGTTFTIFLPVLETAAPASPRAKIAALTQGQGETVLVVEDNADLRQALVDWLEMLNYRVLEASNGRKALAILERQASNCTQGPEQCIAVVLCDLVMPEMGGEALFQALSERGLTLPVVALTGHPMANELQALQAQGLAGWLLKPPDMQQLAATLARVLRTES